MDFRGGCFKIWNPAKCAMEFNRILKLRTSKKIAAVSTRSALLFNVFFFFLDAFTHLYKRVHPFIGPLNFFVFRYVEEGVLGNNNIGINKFTTNFLWLLTFGQVVELPQRFLKSRYYGDFFQKWSPTCDFLKNFQGIFYIKLKAIFINGISFEN